MYNYEEGDNSNFFNFAIGDNFNCINESCQLCIWQTWYTDKYEHFDFWIKDGKPTEIKLHSL